MSLCTLSVTFIVNSRAGYFKTVLVELTKVEYLEISSSKRRFFFPQKFFQYCYFENKNCRNRCQSWRDAINNTSKWNKRMCYLCCSKNRQVCLYPRLMIQLFQNTLDFSVDKHLLGRECIIIIQLLFSTVLLTLTIHRFHWISDRHPKFDFDVEWNLRSSTDIHRNLCFEEKVLPNQQRNLF